jgi:hypothetical protein
VQGSRQASGSLSIPFQSLPGEFLFDGCFQAAAFFVGSGDDGGEARVIVQLLINTGALLHKAGPLLLFRCAKQAADQAAVEVHRSVSQFLRQVEQEGGQDGITLLRRKAAEMGDTVPGTTGRQLVDPLPCNSIGQLPWEIPSLAPSSAAA